MPKQSAPVIYRFFLFTSVMVTDPSWARRGLESLIPPHHLEEVVQATIDYGGSFVMAGGLTMDSDQADRTLQAFQKYDPATEPRLRKLYQWYTIGSPQYSPPQPYNSELGLLVRELCERHSLLDRMPRYIAP